MFCCEWHISFKYYWKALHATSIFFTLRGFLFELEKFFFFFNRMSSLSKYYFYLLSHQNVTESSLSLPSATEHNSVHALNNTKSHLTWWVWQKKLLSCSLLSLDFPSFCLREAQSCFFLEEYPISQVGLVPWQHYFSMLLLMYGTHTSKQSV